jgi:hypothetical protein
MSNARNLSKLKPSSSGLIEIDDVDSSVTQKFAFRNRIINGDMRIDQRNAGASFTVGNFAYGIDRWAFQAVTAAVTAQQVAGSSGNSKAIRITGASGNTIVQVSQRIEASNIYDCASQTVSVSFTLSGSTAGTASVRFLYPTATDNYTSITEPVVGTQVSFTTTPTQYTVSRTLDANASKGLWVLLDFGAVGSGVTRTIEFFQLEKGSTATSFDYRPYGTELALCQRYYQKSFPQGTAPVQNAGTTGCAFSQSAAANGCAPCWVNFPVVMRAAPTTITTYNPSATNGNWRNLDTNTDVNSVIYSSSQSNMFIAANTQTVGQYQIVAIHYTASAEL